MRTKFLLCYVVCILLAANFSFLYAQKSAPKTVIEYLSGKGADDAVDWDFYVTGGMNSGEWTTIKVPSCWETQGFGQFQYGISFYGKPFPEGIAKEEGRYKYEFEAPEEWRNRHIRLVFEASMTDTEVRLNGLKAGPTHQGGFYRFSYDVTDKLRYGGKNLLEVTVKKESENASVNLAERRADYWNFGGIIRPVFLEIKPVRHIHRTAIKAEADGSFTAECYLGNAVSDALSIKAEIFDAAGRKVRETVSPIKKGSDWTTVSMHVPTPALWTAETPNLYTVQFSLTGDAGEILHQTEERFGFRTIEVRESDGLYINGVKVNIRGINRHSFRPETGRTLDREKNYEDVRLIREMNMNAVRLSHYPADPEFLEACDELGLYVMNELAGWHGKYDTPIGKKLVESLVTRDVNHPSVIWWSNGNEKGWNTELDGEYHRWDPQQRPVLHPQGNFGGFETMHYRSYGETQEYLRLPEIFMPTEILHGLYDGGHGAGLYDYWEMMRNHPRCAGAFLWVFADEGVKRVDEDGRIDNQGNYAADGIVGPHHEKEGSFYTVKEIWSPVQIMNERIGKDFDGNFVVENRYDFTSLNACTFKWEQVSFPSVFNAGDDVSVIRSGSLRGSDIAPHESGVMSINMPPFSDKVNGLFVTVIDKFGEELWRWSWRIEGTEKSSAEVSKSGTRASYDETANHIILSASGRKYTFNKGNGYLEQVEADGRSISFGNGPRFFGVRRGDRSFDQFYNHDDPDARSAERIYKEFEDAARLDTVFVSEEGDRRTLHVLYKLGNMKEAAWTVMPDGTVELNYTYNFNGVVDMMGVRFDYPEEKVVGKRWLGDGPYRVWQNRLHGTTYNVWENKYNDPVPGESFTYPEFKGYFANCSWMNIETQEGVISISNETPDAYIGVYQPRDGRDALLYTFPDSGISILDVIPPVRNKVNTTDLIGPSSQPKWANGDKSGRIILRFH
ncbi:putative Beta-galactosidase [Proteiniphilum saccharofermentans]|jgi:hypothetical protein|uniref:beta-galactosidase n=1 Tax=Proteiniphilum saccharofermentans TaxID=1642647 RepID=A0A1R3T859_9BACT|nr:MULTISPECIES: glycoside hydrolase family 2 TIM barrel-domain containing protein [Proteiniphilum]SDZ83973.1 Beta galactosidase small chain [Porphyromonadaceae bacterium KH3R12]SFS71334.1 Beta galactosidase small chain [Porphyromonadaceae bacterium NLAE-zl-C104]SFU56061.1 Beta galactosidase small chain [Porphyromonadaceae bacterium KHP3R9]RNC66751.1 beta-galactosidase [Proteiniphilum sp. X52]SCD21478.1 putative Beta-galactosidase [Proteiniphilum saccharofermentans]